MTATAEAYEGFEGPEKTLNVTLEGPASSAGSMRQVSHERWSRTLELARCQILSVMSNDHCDAFVLSESSLFVYDRRVVLKTCGTTRLLLALDDILLLARDLGLEARCVLYTRKNYTFPERQIAPHTSFEAECAYLDERLGGESVVVGPLTDDHWYFYVHGDLPQELRVFEVRMHELDQESARAFYQEGQTGPDVTLSTGIAGLLPGSDVDEHLFEPCGYSSNALLGPWYATIHVTPEPHCSYASFETNLPMDDYGALLGAVLDVFRPATFTAQIVSHDAASHELHAKGCTVVGPVAAELTGAANVNTWGFVAREDARRARRLLHSSGAVALPQAPECSQISPSPAIMERELDHAGAVHIDV